MQQAGRQAAAGRQAGSWGSASSSAALERLARLTRATFNNMKRKAELYPQDWTAHQRD